jgi:hypothetical protein
VSLRKSFASALVLGGIASALAPLGMGCSGSSGGSGGGGGGGNGSVSVSMTDAPFPFSMVQSAVVTCGQVSIHGNTTSGTSDGFSIIDSTTRTYDLIQLQQGKTALITQASVPAGTYDQIRLVVTQGVITLTDGRVFTLNVPSGSTAGIKVFLNPPITVTSGLSTELVLDFDLSQSFSPVPNSAVQASDVRDFQFHPVIRASAAADSGSIAGKVTSATQAGQPVSGATVTVTSGALVQTTQTASDGTYVVGFLPAGTYTVTVTTMGGGTATASNVAVTTANQTTVNLQL